MGGAINEDSDIYGVIWVGQVELHSCTAHWDVSGTQFSGGSSDVGRDCTRGKHAMEVTNGGGGGIVELL